MFKELHEAADRERSRKYYESEIKLQNNYEASKERRASSSKTQKNT